MDLCVRNNELIGVPDGYKTFFLAKTAHFDVRGCFIAITSKDCPVTTEGETNDLHSTIPEATFHLFDEHGDHKQSFCPYSAKEYLEKDALRVIEVECRGRELRWMASVWDPDVGVRVEYKRCTFLGKRIESEDIFVAL